MAQGLEIIMQDETRLKTCFYDVGAVVYFAKTVPWEFPDFSVENYFTNLCNLQKLIEEKGVIETHEHRFIIVSKKPDSFI